MKDRGEHARAIAARTRIDLVLSLARAARGEVASITGQDSLVEEMVRSLDDIVVAGQIAARKLDTAIPRIP
jgi:hypothetical protein